LVLLFNILAFAPLFSTFLLAIPCVSYFTVSQLPSGTYALALLFGSFLLATASLTLFCHHQLISEVGQNVHTYLLMENLHHLTSVFSC
jgi:hypothetical protein